MKLFDAEHARLNRKSYQEMGLNVQREIIMHEIEKRSRYSDFLIVEEDLFRIKLKDSDWQFFIDLGYKVTLPEIKTYGIPSYGEGYSNNVGAPIPYTRLTFGTISWTDES